MKKTKFVIIGFGKRGSTYLKSLLSDPRVDVVGICDVKKIILPNKKIKYFNSYSNLIEEIDFECAVICTPPKTHYKIAATMIKKGKHVIVEKPFVLKSKEAKKLVLLAKKSRVICFVGYHLRYDSYIKKLKELIQSGEIGKIIMVRGRQSHNWGCKKPFNWSINPAISGGGTIMDNASHYLDLFYDFFGEFKDVFSVSNRLSFKTLVEDSAILMFKFHNNIIGSIEVSWGDGSGRSNGLWIWGTKGVLEYVKNNKGAFLKKITYFSSSQDEWSAHKEEFFYTPEGIELLGKDKAISRKNALNNMLDFFFETIGSSKKIANYYKRNNPEYVVNLINNIYKS